MAQWLKQSTAADVLIGPFVDDTDGKTAETGLSMSATDLYLTKNGAAMVNVNTVQTPAPDTNGFYDVQLDATDTGTLGRLVLSAHVSGALPVWREFMVVPANIYDNFVAGDGIFSAIQGSG